MRRQFQQLRHAFAASGVVDQNVDSAEFLLHVSDHGIDRRPIGDIDPKIEQAPGAFAGLRNLGVADIDNDDIGVALGEALDNALADAAIAAGDDNRFAGKPEFVVFACHVRSHLISAERG
jgi:hypothetical protein